MTAHTLPRRATQRALQIGMYRRKLIASAPPMCSSANCPARYDRYLSPMPATFTSAQPDTSSYSRFRNSDRSYGAVTKTFHWLTALLILSAIPLGIVANDIAHALKNPDIATSEADLTRAVLLFSLHKTIGVAAFFVALARIAWALSQPKPGLLNGDKPLESLAAEIVHWLLYGSLVMVPLSGWIHHAATTGFAPIWWPFGQSLPFVPKDDAIAEIFGGLHMTLTWIMIVSLGLHIAGALKHHVIDKDVTLRRMLPGRLPTGLARALPSARQPRHAPALVGAVLIWAITLTGGAALGFYGHEVD
ncbi:MAG: cytochrome b, partial [Pseudomonadota bacterium]